MSYATNPNRFNEVTLSHIGCRLENVLLMSTFFLSATSWIMFGILQMAPLYLSSTNWVVSRFDLYIWIPAMIIGMLYLRRAFARRLTIGAYILACCLSCAGLLWADSSEIGRGMIHTAAWLSVIPVMAALSSGAPVRFCSRAWIAGTIASGVAGLIYTQLEGHRFGIFLNQTQTAVSNPNGVGCQFALAALLLREDIWIRGSGVASYVARFFVGILVCGVLLTASRTALAALVVVGLALYLRRFRSPGIAVVSGVTCMLIAAALWQGDAVLKEATGLSLTDGVRDRIANDESATLGSFGHRTEIWNYGWDVLWDDNRWFAGVGTGAVEKTLGGYAEYGGREVGRDGIWRLYSHNTYLNWMLEFGLVGIPIGLLLLVALLRHVMRTLRCGTIVPAIILLFFLTVGFSGVIYTESFWIPMTAIMFAASGYRTLERGTPHAVTRRLISEPSSNFARWVLPSEPERLHE